MFIHLDVVIPGTVLGVRDQVLSKTHFVLRSGKKGNKTHPSILAG